jgi:prepilin-type N-terminal cleavage/methylation domain-containing protein
MNIFYFIKKAANRARGFTLLETMVAITLLAVAIVAPMQLTTQSLATAYYARDEVTAFYLAQEGIEVVRDLRDNNILANAQGSPGVNILNNIPVNADFRVDARVTYTSLTTPPLCSLDAGGVCAPLQTDGTLYGYQGAWTTTQFTRKMNACFVQTDGTCTAAVSDEVKVTATVTWQTGSIKKRSVTISENLYRWVADGSAQS